MLMGELSLDGSLRPIKGALPMAILARALQLDGSCSLTLTLPMTNPSRLPHYEVSPEVSVEALRL